MSIVKSLNRFSIFFLGLSLVIAVVVSVSLWSGTDIKAAEKPALDSALKVDASQKAAIDAVKAKIEKDLPGLAVDEITQSPVSSLFEIISGGEIYYVTKDGKNLFSGRLLSIENGIVDLTQQSKQKLATKLSPYRKKIVDAIKDSDTFFYKAKDEKHRINVFVDVDCGYCRKLHKEIPQLNAMGITVRYLAFPRAGLSSSAASKIISAFCADDRNKAISDAFERRPLIPKTCENPIAYQYSLVRKFGINGTPSIIFANGDLWPGYLKAADILKAINKRGL